MRRERMRVFVQFFRREPRCEPWPLQREHGTELEKNRGRDNPDPKNRRRFPAKCGDFFIDAQVREARKIVGTRVVRGEGEAHELVHAQHRRGSPAS